MNDQITGTNVPEAPPIATPPQAPVEVKRPKVWAYILVTFLVTSVLMGAGGYYMGMNSGFKKGPVAIGENSQEPGKTNLPLASGEMLEDPTENWETYTGKEYEFKFPKGLKSDTGAAGSNYESIRVQFMGPKQIESGRTQTSLFDGYAFVVTKIDTGPDKSPALWVEEMRKSLSEDICGPNVSASEVSEIKIGKAEGLSYRVKGCLGDYTMTVIESNSIVYQITQLYVGDEADQKKYEQITNQILNTLKFL